MFTRGRLFNVRVGRRVSHITGVGVVVRSSNRAGVVAGSKLGGGHALRVRGHGLGFRSKAFSLVVAGPPFNSAVGTSRIKCCGRCRLFRGGLKFARVGSQVTSSGGGGG